MNASNHPFRARYLSATRAVGAGFAATLALLGLAAGGCDSGGTDGEGGDDTSSSSTESSASTGAGGNTNKETVDVDANIAASTTFTADKNWLIKGKIVVEAGAELTIEPGTTVFGDPDSLGTLIIAQGAGARVALYQAAHIILTKPVKGSALKRWALQLAKRVGMNKAKVALARKLAVIMHRMLVDGTPFNPAAGAAA